MSVDMAPIGWLPCLPDGTPTDPKDGLFDDAAHAMSFDATMATAVYSQAQLDAAVAAEREACALVAQAHSEDGPDKYGFTCQDCGGYDAARAAESIRARGRAL